MGTILADMTYNEGIKLLQIKFQVDVICISYILEDYPEIKNTIWYELLLLVNQYCYGLSAQKELHNRNISHYNA